MEQIQKLSPTEEQKAKWSVLRSYAEKGMREAAERNDSADGDELRTAGASEDAELDELLVAPVGCAS